MTMMRIIGSVLIAMGILSVFTGSAPADPAAALGGYTAQLLLLGGGGYLFWKGRKKDG
jgi:LPXTG-motif cell wall-anchored protein